MSVPRENLMLFEKQLRTLHPALPACWILALIRSKQTFDRHMSSSRANQALRSMANAGFQNRGVCLQVCKRFLPSPSPPPSFIFCLSFHFSRGQNRESRSSVFLCSETARKRLQRRLVILGNTFTFKSGRTRNTDFLENHCFLWYFETVRSSKSVKSRIFIIRTATGSEHFAGQGKCLPQIFKVIVSTSAKKLKNINVVVWRQVK